MNLKSFNLKLVKISVNALNLFFDAVATRMMKKIVFHIIPAKPSLFKDVLPLPMQSHSLKKFSVHCNLHNK